MAMSPMSETVTFFVPLEIEAVVEEVRRLPVPDRAAFDRGVRILFSLFAVELVTRHGLAQLGDTELVTAMVVLLMLMYALRRPGI